MFIAQALAREFVAHVTGCPSGIIACSARAAVESWFQVELASMLLKSNRFDSVQFGYDYPGGGKADLAAKKKRDASFSNLSASFAEQTQTS